MKFYKDKYFFYSDKIFKNKLSAILCRYRVILFYKKGKLHNTKNGSYIDSKYKEFHLNGKYYVNNVNFTKKSWRKFVKLQAFL